jgi:hypothetical protein
MNWIAVVKKEALVRVELELTPLVIVVHDDKYFTRACILDDYHKEPDVPMRWRIKHFDFTNQEHYQVHDGAQRMY